MNRKAIASAVAIALAATTMAAAGGSAPAVEGSVHEVADGRVVTLDPAGVRAAIEEGRAFELPAKDGSVSVSAGARVRDTISYAGVADDGTRTTVDRPINVWWIETEDRAAQGVVLSFNHTLRAWLRDANGTTLVQPLAEGPGMPLPVLEYVVHRVEDLLGGDAPLPSGAGGVTILSHIKVWRSIYAYVDPEFANQYGGCCWPDQITYILSLLNGYFDDVELEYWLYGAEIDSGFNTNDMNAAWDRLIYKSYAGANVKSYWSYRDFDGCEVGAASTPGSIFLIQHNPDDCHLNLVPATDAENAYFTSRELGKNQNAHPNYHWSSTTWYGHEHRSIMKDSLWGHLHGCWSGTNMNRMSSYLGTSSVGSAC